MEFISNERTIYNSRRISEVEIDNLAEKEFRVVIVMMIQDLRKRIEAKTERIQEALIKSLESLKNRDEQYNN